MKMGSFSSKIGKSGPRASDHWSRRADAVNLSLETGTARILRHSARLRSKWYSRYLWYVSSCALYPRMTFVSPYLRAWGRPPWASWRRCWSPAWLRGSDHRRISWQRKRSKWCILALYRVRWPQYFAQRTPTCTYAPHSTRMWSFSGPWSHEKDAIRTPLACMPPR